jgi:hypothetical protein
MKRLINRLIERDDWVSEAVRAGLEAFARESAGTRRRDP